MKQYDAIIIGFGKAGKTLGCRTFQPRMASCHRGTFQHDVWRNLSEHSLYSNQNAGA